MVDKINTGINPLNQKFSSNGVKLSELKDNKLLFNYFTNAGYKEDAVIYSTDIEKLKKSVNTDENEKLTYKELKKFGFEGSRKELNELRNKLDEIESASLEDSKELLPEKTGKDEINYRDGKGNLIYNEKTFDKFGYKVRTTYINGDTTLVDKREEYTLDGKPKQTEEFLDGDVNKPLKITYFDRNGNKTSTMNYQYDGERLHTSTAKTGQEVQFIKYQNDTNGKPVPKVVMDYVDGNPDSFKSVTNNIDNTEGTRTGQTIEYSGTKIKNGVIKEEVKLTEPAAKDKVTQKDLPEDMIQSKTVTVLDDKNKQNEKYFQNFDGKLHQIEKDDKGNSFVTVKIPQGWSISKLAKEFGVSKETILQANVDSDGDKLYHTNANGVEYFYADDKVKILNPTKISQEKLEFLYGKDAKLPEIKKEEIQKNPSNTKPSQTHNTKVNNNKQPHKKTVSKPNIVENKRNNVTTKTHYEKDDKPVQKDVFRNGKKVRSKIYKDGKLSSVISYDSKGNVVQKTNIKYNSKNQKVETIYDKNNNLVSEITYRRNSNTILNSSTYFDGGRRKYETEFAGNIQNRAEYVKKNGHWVCIDSQTTNLRDLS